MTRSGHLEAGALSALYLLWLAPWLVLGEEPYGPSSYHWDQAVAAAVTGCLAFAVSIRHSRPYTGFLATQGLAFLLLAGSWLTYQVSGESSGLVAVAAQGASVELSDLTS